VTADKLEVEPVSAYVDRSAADGRLVLDDDGRPQGWVVEGHDGLRPLPASFTAEDTLRLATDLAITSPAGAAVRVDGDGVADGVVAHEAIARHLTSLRHEAER
jgi:osmoprotectant transport system ATP-binding protein